MDMDSVYIPLKVRKVRVRGVRFFLCLYYLIV